ncbi:MAG: hypothetical protein JO250_07865 [Armatimonadetes bacterium]|nr:hypothetical protein [Armatimonadota bacterium]
MTTIVPAGSISDQAEAIFEAQIKPGLLDADPEDFLAIDVNTGDYEIARDDMTPGDRLRERHPDARIFLRRVGDQAAYTVGWGYRP